MNLINGCYGYGYGGIPTNLVVKELVFNYLGSLDIDSYLTNTIIRAANEATDKALAAAELANNTDVSQLQLMLDNQKVDTGITVTPSIDGQINRPLHEFYKDRVHVRSFGVIGDGVADDTESLVKAITSGVALDFGDLIIRHTGIDLNVESINWTSKGVKFKYDGAYQKTAFNIVVTKHSVMAGSYEFDANKKCHVSVSIHTDAPLDNRPSLIINKLKSINAYRKSKDFSGGDGIFIGGGFNILDVDEIEVDKCHMAVGADIFSAQGIFGFTAAFYNSKRIKHINIRTIRVSNVWSEDPNYKNDQDGIRIFQDLTDKESTCNIGTYYCTNVANRAIKFHSCLNPNVGKIYRVLDSSVIPQSGEFSNPDVDGQQAGINIGSIDFEYIGAYHAPVMQGYHDLRYATTSVNTIGAVKGDFRNINADDVVLLSLQPNSVNSDYRTSISNVNVTGITLNSIVSVNLRSGSTAVVNVSNVTAALNGSVIRPLGSTTVNLYGLISSITNTASSPVPILSKTSSTFIMQDIGCIGVIGSTIRKNNDGVGIGGEAKVTLDIYAQGVGGQQVRLNGSRVLSAIDSNYIGWYEWYHQVNDKRLGLIGFVDTSSDMRITNELDGAILIRILGSTRLSITKDRILLNTAKVNAPNLPTSSTGLTAGDLWNDAGTLKIAL